MLEALDEREQIDPTIVTLEARPGDRLLLCSDGLSDLVDHATIEQVLRVGSREACVDQLIQLALKAGVRDNVGVWCLPCGLLAGVRARPRPTLSWPTPATGTARRSTR